jgi:ubiquinone/menaquinone biosynthesis C-methylase UbiE
MGNFANPAAYELWMGRWSRRLAPMFVTFAGLAREARLLDVGSGAGALSVTLLEGVPGATVIGIEPSEAYVSYARETISDERLRFEVGDAQDIPFDDDSFDAALSLLILQELSDAPQALAEMRRVTRPGGPVAASQWDFAKGMPMLALFWDTVQEVVASEAARRAAADCMDVDYPDETALRSLWRNAGLVEVEAERHGIEMAFASFEDYWTPFLSNVTPTSSYIGELEAGQAAEIESRLREKLIGEAPDRSFNLRAHAWAVRGKVPFT